jgi:PhzF family phenazine biosynthesis protein
MQKIASILNFSESVFILSSNIFDYNFRFFSPIKEVDICAHATIAAIYALNENYPRNEINIITKS